MSIRIDRDRMSCETKASSFWADHNEDLHDPEYALAFARESQRVAAVDLLARIKPVDHELVARRHRGSAAGVDEDALAALLLPPGGRDELGCAPLHLARQHRAW